MQIAETCSDGNEVQLITAAIPQGASTSDMDSEKLVQEKLFCASSFSGFRTIRLFRPHNAQISPPISVSLNWNRTENDLLLSSRRLLAEPAVMETFFDFYGISVLFLRFRLDFSGKRGIFIESNISGRSSVWLER